MSLLRSSLQAIRQEYGTIIRQNHNLSIKERAYRKMRGWQVHSYGGIEELQLAENAKIPTISNANEVLVKVQTAGVNPIDVAMLRGYGAPILKLARNATTDIEFPLTFGREFTGVVVQKGMGVSDRLKTGQTVWGVVPLQKQGSHAEYVVVSESTVTELPQELNSVEGSAVLYAGLTAWSGIFLVSNLGSLLPSNCLKSESSLRDKRVLILGASGSVGSLAAQILKAEHAIVIGSCSSDAMPMVQTLGVDHIIDYTDESSSNAFSQCGPYDLILDCAGQGQDGALKYGWQFKEFVTFSTPLLRNVDEHGLIFGMAKNVADLATANIKTLSTKQACVKWAYFVPSLRGIEYLKCLVERKKLLPKIDSVYGFDEAPEAYKKVKEGHLRGKVVIDFHK